MSLPIRRYVTPSHFCTPTIGQSKSLSLDGEWRTPAKSSEECEGQTTLRLSGDHKHRSRRILVAQEEEN